jgi:hypothetical protein
MEVSGSVFSFNTVTQQSMEESSSLIRNTIHGRSQTFSESPVSRLENPAKRFQAALPIKINKFNCTEPNIKASSDSFCNSPKITSGQLAAPIMCTRV